MASKKKATPSKQEYRISKAQLDVLVERAGEEAVSAALIQNGSAPTDFSVSRPQLNMLLERAGAEAVSAALIQNGSAPTDFTTLGRSVKKPAAKKKASKKAK